MQCLRTARKVRPACSQRGYTAVELVMAIGIFAVGVTGVFAMQRVTSGANAHAKNVAIATYAAESWLEQLAVDATLWTQTAQLTGGNTLWLNELGDADTTGWYLPATVGSFGAGFDPLGANIANTSAAFCTHLRLTSLMDEPTGLIRAEVRVFWPKPGPASPTSPTPAEYCPTTSTDVSAVGADTDYFHFVYKATVLRQTGAGLE